MQSESSSLYCHLVLLGQVGAGKSATGNTILGQRSFQSKKSLKAVTQVVQRGTVTINGLNIEVYDTPGFLGPGLQSGDIESKCQTLLCLDASVPTVFLLVIDTDRFAEQEKQAADFVLKFLGENNVQNTWIIFTKGDELQSNDVTIEEYMEESEDLKELVQKVNHQYKVFNNKRNPSNREQAEELISQIMRTNMRSSQNQRSHTTQHEHQHQNQGVERLHTDQSWSFISDPRPLQIKPDSSLSDSDSLFSDSDFGSLLSDSESLISEPRSLPLTETRSTSSDRNNTLSPRRIMLLGKTGVGKSSTGNTILGRHVFKCDRDINAVTTESSARHTNINGNKVSVIDMPGFFDTKLDMEKLAEEFGRGLHLSEGGVHAFLLIFEYGRFTEQEEELFRQVKKVFGEDVMKHVIIVFTHGDECDREKLASGIKQNKLLTGVIKKCGGRYCVINNRDMRNREQVSELLQMINEMLEANGGRFYTSEMFNMANKSPFDDVINTIKELFNLQLKF